ncbi:MAG TPA: hypothetical protein VH722_19085 [Alphaproteobacteria bacterium]|jgi:hypothetical protein|nr:hypothetical protein [Alphaproteobacteria bacterium]
MGIGNPIAALANVRFQRAGAGFAIAVSCAGLAVPRPALAQNLVQDPNFFNGLADYQTVGDVQAFDLPYAPQPPGGYSDSNPNVAVLYGPGGGGDVPAMVTQSIATVPNAVYLVTFAINFDPGITDSLLASFGTGSFSLNPTVEPDGLATYSFTGKATATATDLTFTADSGAMLVTELDVEAGPAPVTGGGILSFACLLAGLAFRQMRRSTCSAPVR